MLPTISKFWKIRVRFIDSGTEKCYNLKLVLGGILILQEDRSIRLPCSVSLILFVANTYESTKCFAEKS